MIGFLAWVWGAAVTDARLKRQFAPEPIADDDGTQAMADLIRQRALAVRVAKALPLAEDGTAQSFLDYPQSAGPL